MAIKNPFKADKAKSAVGDAPDWRTHPGITGHEQRITDLEMQLSELTPARESAEETLHAAEDSVERATYLTHAGKASDEARDLSAAQAALEDARRAHARAKYAEAAAAAELATLRQQRQAVIDQTRAAVAAQHDETMRALLDDFAAALTVTMAKADAARAYYWQHVNEQYPPFHAFLDELPNSAVFFNPGLSFGGLLATAPFDALASTGQPGVQHTPNQAQQWLALYQRWADEADGKGHANTQPQTK